MTWMLIRLVLSLAFVGLVLWFAARVAKKRGLGGGGAHGLIEVVARQRIGRSSSVNVVRIGDVVLVVGATEEQVTLLAEMDGETIDAAQQDRDGGRAPRLPAREPRPAAALDGPQDGRRYAADRRAPQERPAEDYEPAPRYESAPRYEAAGYEVPGYEAAHYEDRSYAEQAYDGEGYSNPSAQHSATYSADPGGYGDGYAEPAREARRAGGQHADHRYGGGHRPASTPSAASGPLAGSVFDKNGWGTFVNELRERTVRRP